MELNTCVDYYELRSDPVKVQSVFTYVPLHMILKCIDHGRLYKKNTILGLNTAKTGVN